MVNFQQNLVVYASPRQGPVFPQALVSVIDTAGSDQFMIDVSGGKTASTTPAKFGWLRLYHGEEAGPVSNMTAIDGWEGTTNSTATSSQFVLPTHTNTETGQVIRFMSSTAPFGRYIGVELAAPSVGGGQASVVCVSAYLSGSGLGTQASQGVNLFLQK